MANKQKHLKKLDRGGSRHISERKVLRAREKWYRHEYSCYLKDESSSVLLLLNVKNEGKEKVKMIQRRNMKNKYQLYRSPETGQLRNIFQWKGKWL